MVFIAALFTYVFVEPNVNVLELQAAMLTSTRNNISILFLRAWRVFKMQSL